MTFGEPSHMSIVAENRHKAADARERQQRQYHATLRQGGKSDATREEGAIEFSDGGPGLGGERDGSSIDGMPGVCRGAATTARRVAATSRDCVNEETAETFEETRASLTLTCVAPCDDRHRGLTIDTRGRDSGTPYAARR